MKRTSTTSTTTTTTTSSSLSISAAQKEEIQKWEERCKCNFIIVPACVRECDNPMLKLEALKIMATGKEDTHRVLNKCVKLWKEQSGTLIQKQYEREMKKFKEYFSQFQKE